MSLRSGRRVVDADHPRPDLLLELADHRVPGVRAAGWLDLLGRGRFGCRGGGGRIIGGGPGGLQAALTASRMGHEVELWEQSDVLGGQIRFAHLAPFKEEMAGILTYLIRCLKNSAVTIRSGQQSNESDIIAYNPDVVIVSTGSRSGRPPRSLGALPKSSTPPRSLLAAPAPTASSIARRRRRPWRCAWSASCPRTRFSNST